MSDPGSPADWEPTAARPLRAIHGTPSRKRLAEDIELDLMVAASQGVTPEEETNRNSRFGWFVGAMIARVSFVATGLSRVVNKVFGRENEAVEEIHRIDQNGNALLKRRRLLDEREPSAQWSLAPAFDERAKELNDHLQAVEATLYRLTSIESETATRIAESLGSALEGVDAPDRATGDDRSTPSAVENINYFIDHLSKTRKVIYDVKKLASLRTRFPDGIPQTLDFGLTSYEKRRIVLVKKILTSPRLIPTLRTSLEASQLNTELHELTGLSAAMLHQLVLDLEAIDADLVPPTYVSTDSHRRHLEQMFAGSLHSSSNETLVPSQQTISGSLLKTENTSTPRDTVLDAHASQQSQRPDSSSSSSPPPSSAFSRLKVNAQGTPPKRKQTLPASKLSFSRAARASNGAAPLPDSEHQTILQPHPSPFQPPLTTPSTDDILNVNVPPPRPSIDSGALTVYDESTGAAHSPTYKLSPSPDKPSFSFSPSHHSPSAQSTQPSHLPANSASDSRNRTRTRTFNHNASDHSSRDSFSSHSSHSSHLSHSSDHLPISFTSHDPLYSLSTMPYEDMPGCFPVDDPEPPTSPASPTSPAQQFYDSYSSPEREQPALPRRHHPNSKTKRLRFYYDKLFEAKNKRADRHVKIARNAIAHQPQTDPSKLFAPPFSPAPDRNGPLAQTIRRINERKKSILRQEYRSRCRERRAARDPSEPRKTVRWADEVITTPPRPAASPGEPQPEVSTPEPLSPYQPDPFFSRYKFPVVQEPVDIEAAQAAIATIFDEPSVLRISSHSGYAIQAQKEREAREAEEARRKIEEAIKAREEAARVAAEEQRQRELQERLARTHGLGLPRRRIVEQLSTDWVRRAQDTLRASPATSLATTSEGIELRRHDFAKVVPPTEWLNDEIVNGSLAWLDRAINSAAGIKNTRAHTRKCLALNSFFWKQLVERGPERTQRALRRNHVDKNNFLDVDTILLPICENLHWTLVVVRPSHRTIAHMDSLNPRGNAHNTDLALRWVQSILEDRYVETDWQIVRHDAPRQTNGWDCGVHTITNAMCVALGLNPTDCYDAHEMPLQRIRIACMLLNQGFSNDFDLRVY